LDNHPISCYHLGHYFQVDGKQLQEQYKEHISDYSYWNQKAHADDWMLFVKNVSPGSVLMKQLYPMESFIPLW